MSGIFVDFYAVHLPIIHILVPIVIPQDSKMSTNLLKGHSPCSLASLPLAPGSRKKLPLIEILYTVEPLSVGKLNVPEGS